MNRTFWVSALLVLTAVAPAPAGPLGKRSELDRVNAQLAGQVVDFTHNHGQDHRIWSPALECSRDLYVYLPPNYDPACRYPVVLYLHAFQQDEVNFLDPVVKLFDCAIQKGILPPLIVAAPDGSITGRPTWFGSGSFFINSKAGRFEDYIIEDVWGFVTSHFSVRPEREAHVILGASMGGFGAYNLGIKHPEIFKIVAAIFPPLNIRWVDCHGVYRAPFCPDCIGFRTDLRPHEVLARFYGVPVRMKSLINPLYGRSRGRHEEIIEGLSRENPTEMLAAYNVQPDSHDFYIGYGGKDQFNVAAQVESFVYFANERGIHVDLNFLPDGKHDQATGVKLFPGTAEWLGKRLAPFGPVPAAP